MPFAGGIKISARNAGQSPLGSLAVQVAVERDAPAALEPLGIDRRWRLRGQFHRAADAGPLAVQQGPGRWIGLVLANDGKSAPGVGALTVDGREQPGWAADRFDEWLGAGRGDREFFRVLSGRAAGLRWRYLLLAPVEFHAAFELQAKPGAADAWSLFYMQPRPSPQP